MPTPRWERVVAPKASSICASLKLPDHVRGLLNDHADPAAFFQALVAREEYEAATVFLALRCRAAKESGGPACARQAAHGKSLPPKEESCAGRGRSLGARATEANRRAAKCPARNWESSACAATCAGRVLVGR